MKALIGKKLDEPGRTRAMLDIEKKGKFMKAELRGDSAVLWFDLGGDLHAQVWLDGEESGVVSEKLGKAAGILLGRG